MSSHRTDCDLIATARRLIEPVRDLAGQMRDLLDATGQITPIPQPSTPGQTPLTAFIDGAVAHEQTDALTWIAATGARLTDDHAPAVESATAVAPVSGDTERLRSALMASCELLAATSTESPAERVIMDGGLATPLISLSQGLLVRDPDVERTIREHYTQIDLPAVVDRYVTLIEQGRVAALPKQDTATGYTTEWARAHRHDFEHPDSASALSRMRDRPLAGSLLLPGEWLRPRHADELARTEIKAARTDTPDPLAQALAPHYERLARTEGLHVAYFKPRRLPERVIKIEYREDDPATWATGAGLSALIDGVTMGPRVKEPLPQYQADAAAKKAVTSTLTETMHSAAAMLDAPAATYRYRT